MTSESYAVTAHEAGLVFQKMSTAKRKELFYHTRKFMNKLPPPRCFTYRLLDNRRLQKAISKDIRTAVETSSDQLEDFREMFDEAAPFRDCNGLQASVDLLFDLTNSFYFNHKVFKIFMYGFFHGRNDAMMAKYKCIRFLSDADTLFDLGINLWRILDDMKEELGYDWVYKKFIEKAKEFRMMISQHSQGKVELDQPWYSIDVDSNLDFFEIWRPLEYAVFGENLVSPRPSKSREEMRLEISSREEIRMSDSEESDTSDWSSSAPSSPRSDSDGEMEAKTLVQMRREAVARRRRTRPRDSFDRYLDLQGI